MVTPFINGQKLALLQGPLPLGSLAIITLVGDFASVFSFIALFFICTAIGNFSSCLFNEQKQLLLPIRHKILKSVVTKERRID